MHLSRAKSISARTNRILNRIGGARSQVLTSMQQLTLSCVKMGLRARLKDPREGESMVKIGREFQILGAAPLKALGSMPVLTDGCANFQELLSM